MLAPVAETLLREGRAVVVAVKSDKANRRPARDDVDALVVDENAAEDEVRE
jgi:hypothetical protein